jgi:hypothetical protein
LPIVAGGNADVDIEMLTAASFSLLVDHDDEEREFAYTEGPRGRSLRPRNSAGPS